MVCVQGAGEGVGVETGGKVTAGALTASAGRAQLLAGVGAAAVAFWLQALAGTAAACGFAAATTAAVGIGLLGVRRISAEVAQVVLGSSTLAAPCSFWMSSRDFEGVAARVGATAPAQEKDSSRGAS